MFKNTKIFFQKAIVEQPDALSAVEYIAKQLVKRYRILNKINKYQNQLVAKAIKYPRVSPLNRLAIAVLNKRGQVWQVVALIENIVGKNKENPRLYYQLGMAQNKMHRFDQAAESFNLANRYAKGLVKWKYMEGLMLQRAGKLKEAGALYAEAIELDNKYGSKKIGVGALHYQYGEYKEAVEALEAEPLQDPLFFQRLGEGYFKLAEWEKSELNYSKAIKLNAYNAEQIVILANLQEKQGKYSEAVASFDMLANLHGEVPQNQLYRYGFCLAKLGEYKRACEVFGQIYKNSDIDSVSKTKQADLSIEYYSKGLQAESQSDFTSAVNFYSKAIDSTSEHVEMYYYKLASMLASVGKYQEACANFIETKIFKNVFNQPSVSQYRNSLLLKVLEYNELFDNQDLDESMILYESYHGKKISCSPYAIFKEIVENKKFEGFKHVWVLNDPANVPQSVKSHESVILVKRDSQQYRKYLTKAKYLINNTSFPYYFIRKEDQRYMNTWHGTPLKTLGKDIKYAFMEHANVARNFLHTTHLISPNKHTEDVLIDQFDISNSFVGRKKVTGYPRNDFILNACLGEKNEIKQRLGISSVNHKKPVVLYAPTWRGQLGNTKGNKNLGDVLNLAADDYILVYQGHYFEGIRKVRENKNIIVPPDGFDATELLSVTDILITDYSSIFFDFLCTKKPILFFTYDIEEYNKERGLYFSVEEMPGEVTYDIDSLRSRLASTLKLLNNGAWKIDEKYQQALNKFAPNEDGSATIRAIDFLISGNTQLKEFKPLDERKKLLFYVGSFTPNGITTVALNLLNSIDFQQYRVVLAIDKDSVGNDTERMQKFSQLSDKIEVIARVGHASANPEEKAAFNRYYANKKLTSYEWELILKASKKEFRRVFGFFKPDFIINFDGYARPWAAIFAAGITSSGNEKAKLIYQHNDLYAEALTKFPYLRNIFCLYRYYGKLVSVSEGIAKDNCSNIAEKYGISPSKFMYSDNPPDLDTVVSRSNEPLEKDLLELVSGVPKGQLFVTFGRLSPEKNHILLFDAFKSLIKKYPLAKLIVLGEGPLRGFLEYKLSEYKLDENIFLPGLKLNPFPLLKRSDCFLLPSIHEGQPMVLLEVMALNKSVIATKITGVKLLLDRFNYGMQVDLDAGSMIKAMEEIIVNPKAATSSVDLKEYRENTLEQFYNLLK